MEKVGIVILNYNGSEVLKLTLDSLRRSENDTRWSVNVVDNGSSQEDKRRARAAVTEVFGGDGETRCTLIDLPENKGFSGGNNVAIRRFLDDPEITHICLLNSDVIVPDHWLDILIRQKKDAVGPVTNAAGNEQTILTDIAPKRDLTAVESVNEFAEKRRSSYETCCCESEMITFFAVLLTRGIVEKVGLLDERFFPGSFEDDDYCIRLRQAGVRLWVARGCYVHHWGSGSFSKLDGERRIHISEDNKRRLEEKWHIQWQDRTPTLQLSPWEDAEHLLRTGGNSTWAVGMVEKSFAELEGSPERVSALEAEVARLRGELAGLGGEIAGLRSELSRVENNKIRRIYRRFYNLFSPRWWHDRPRAVRRRALKAQRAALSGLARQVFDAMDRSGKKGICVFTAIFRQTNIADGYYQRIRAIDGEILGGYYKIYLRLEDKSYAPRLELIDDTHAEVILDPGDPEQAKILQRLVLRCGRAYIHSVLRVMLDKMPEKTRAVLADRRVSVIWDVHGSVPEEAALYHDYYGAQLSGEAEEFLIRHADIAIAVDGAMKEHLENKYRSDVSARLVVLPIFNPDLLGTPDWAEEKKLADGERPLAVYAGGLHKWQKIPLMQDVIEKAGDRCRYLILVPKPDEFLKDWGERKKPSEMAVRSALPAEVQQQYRACHYGFVLRDDIVVNNVACPTKLIEYVQYGILPVMHTPNVGDFVKLGMHYLSDETFAAGRLPSEVERRRLTDENKEVLKKLAAMSASGKSELLALLEKD